MALNCSASLSLVLVLFKNLRKVSWYSFSSTVYLIFCSYMQVLLTPTDLAIVMEYAAGGELFERICNAGRFSEDEVIGAKAEMNGSRFSSQ